MTIHDIMFLALPSDAVIGIMPVSYTHLSVEAAKLYYQELNNLQQESDRPLNIATIFSFAPNEEQSAKGDIKDEKFDPSAMDSSAKEFLAKAIGDYNVMFKTNFGVDSKEFQNYYR